MRALATLAATLVVGGCLPGSFDDLQDQATVESLSQPEGAAESEDFPFAIAYVESSGPPQGDNPVAMRFVTLALNPPVLSTFEYRLDGSIDAVSAGIEMRHDPGPLGFAALGAGAGNVSGLIAVEGRNGRIELYDARDGTVGPVHLETLDTSTCLAGPHQGAGEKMVLAETGAGGAGVDLVAMAGTSLVVFTDIDARPGGLPPACFSCSLVGTIQGNFTGNNLATIDLDGFGEEDESEIVAAFRDTDAPGSRWDIFGADQIETDDNAVCFSATPQAGDVGGAPGFGRQIAVGDFNGNGVEGVAFADPEEDEVVVILDIGSGSGPSGPPRMIEIPGSVRFGGAIAAGDVDGEAMVEDDADELLVADFERDAEGEFRAGIVHVFDLTSPESVPGFRELKRLHDSAPNADQTFGRSLAVGEFLIDEMNDESDDLVIAGAEGEVFTFFAIEDAVDPRR